jgi:hypothetical protein
MWLWLDDSSEPENLFIPANLGSSTGEYESLRSEVAYYWLAVSEFLATGDDSELSRFAAAHMEIDGRVHFFQRDLDMLEEAGMNGELDFDSIDSGGGE